MRTDSALHPFCMSAFAHRGQSTCRWGSVSTDAPSGIRLRPDLESAPANVGTVRMPPLPRPRAARQDVTMPLAPMNRPASAPVTVRNPVRASVPAPVAVPVPVAAPVPVASSSVHSSVAYAAPSPGVEAIMLAVARAVSSRSEPPPPPSSSSLGHRLFLVAATALVAVFGTLLWMNSGSVRVQNAPAASSPTPPAPPLTPVVEQTVVDAPATPPLPASSPIGSRTVRLAQSSSSAPPTSGKLASVTPPSSTPPKTNDDAARAAELLKKQLANSVD